MVNFWSPLLRCLVNKGHEPLCLVPPPAPGDDPSWEQALAALGVRVEHYPLDRKGLNPVRDLGSLAALTGILRREQPDRLFAFTIKAVIYGCLAAALAACPPRQQRFAMISGLGYMFEGDTRGKRLLTQLARLLYRLALQCCGVVIFQNEDDRKLFEKLSIIPRTTHIRSSRGTGVDTEFFALAPQAAGPPIFLFVGRLLEAKGLRDFMAAARIVRQQHPEAQFHVLGPPEPGPGGLPLQEVLAAQEKGDIKYLGESRDVRPHLAAALAVVLPSWREGTPCSLLEAMSTGRAVIAADAPGSREVVRHKENGLLVPVRDAKALASAMKELMMNADRAHMMGAAGRRLAEGEFGATSVANALLDIMRL
ncbi:glycosyltransferase family 4 protein [Desulfovibrio sp. OttesenSCG-928-M16]|nr:glycosyltransferase family 4 protein [Desulfovibrio sp. OttesenSCG-928-M16]